MNFPTAVAWTARAIEAAGVVTMALGIVVSGGRSLASWRTANAESAHRTFRQSLGRAILLGLELLVAADIIRTVSEIPTLERAVVLALIVAIRTFLSFTLEVELSGRWPWQGRADETEASAVRAPRG